MLQTTLNKLKQLSGFGVSLVMTLTTAMLPLQSAFAKSETITATYPYNAFIEDPENPWNSPFDALDATGTNEYRDDYFNVPSPGIHSKLRAVSYALALAGFENERSGYPSESSSTYPKLIDFLNQLGFSDYQSWDAASDEDGHSMGTTIGHKTLSSGQELIVIAPRNYDYQTEWISNFNVGTSGDHAGFSESANLIYNRFNDYLKNHEFENYKVWVVGYSRGGAVVDLFAKKINENLNNYKMSSSDLYAYTFGAPRASVTETKYSNIHDVKDGNDLILGYIFPKIWGFYNTGTYEEIHPADLEITTAMIDISKIADSSEALQLLASNDGVVKEDETVRAKDFMDDLIKFVTANGFTREYFDTEIKAPLSAIAKAYQLRTIDKQDEFLNFMVSTEDGMINRVAGNAFQDLVSRFDTSIEKTLDDFPPYRDIVSALKGTATDAELDEATTYFTSYIDEYDNYYSPAVDKNEFAVIKENFPKLARALAPFVVADAKYTQDTFGEDYSLFYTYSLAANATKLVYGHIPESLMPILKSLDIEENLIPKAPDTGRL